MAVLAETTDPAQIEQAIEVIAANLDTLTAEQLDQIVATVSAAPVEVKRAFESQVNIFGGGLDEYVPADSNVTVAQRRALVAVGAVLVAAPAVVGRRK